MVEIVLSKKSINRSRFEENEGVLRQSLKINEDQIDLLFWGGGLAVNHFFLIFLYIMVAELILLAFVGRASASSNGLSSNNYDLSGRF